MQSCSICTFCVCGNITETYSLLILKCTPKKQQSSRQPFFAMALILEYFIITLSFCDNQMLFTFMHWRRKWQPTSVFLPGESQRQWSLVGCPLWGRTESDTTEASQQQQQQTIYISCVCSFQGSFCSTTNLSYFCFLFVFNGFILFSSFTVFFCID